LFPSFFNKPEYYFQPLNIIRKYLKRSAESFSDLSGIVLTTANGDYMQRALQRTGLYDLALTEVIWQFAQPGCLHVDVGANVGYVSRIMQLKAGANGRTASVEPNLEVLPMLEKNRLLTPHNAQWRIYPMAAGEAQGELWLKQPAAYASNHGTAHITASEEPDSIAVPVTTLDILFAEEKISLLKIDVEGFEWNVLQGAKELLAAGQIENIVFEDFEPWPGQVPVYLQSMGYHIYAIRKGWRKVSLFAPDVAPSVSTWEEPNYLATKLGKVELDRKFGKGYTCLHGIPASVKG
jgi:FkbM family methyltransferase